MWLPWKGIPNQIRIEQDPRLKYFYIGYQNTSNEVLVFEASLGNYVLAIDTEEKKVEEVLMMHDTPKDLT